MEIRKFDIRRDIGVTNADIRRIVGAFADGDSLWVEEDDTVYDAVKRIHIGHVRRICYPDGFSAA